MARIDGKKIKTEKQKTLQKEKKCCNEAYSFIDRDIVTFSLWCVGECSLEVPIEIFFLSIDFMVIISVSSRETFQFGGGAMINEIG